MKLVENKCYHYYNQGNNRQKIFFTRENYLFFLQNFRKFVAPHATVLAYCLMPNHLHFLIYTTQNSLQEKKVEGLMIPALNNGFRQLLSSYSQAINKQQNRSGSLFRQRTKAKLLENKDEYYPLICFHYIHQNPLNAGLTNKMNNRDFSSFQDYTGFRKGTLCDQNIAFELLDISKENLYEESYNIIPDEKIHALL